MAKADLIAEAKRLGIALDGSEKVADLEALIADTEDEPTDEPTEGNVIRRRLNRGSRRRLERAAAEIDKAMLAAIKEFDLQAFVADDEGERLGPWPLVTRMKEMRQEIATGVTDLLHG